MIFGKLPMRGARESANRQIKTRRTILAFIISIGEEINDFMSLIRILQYICGGAVNLGITATAPFVVHVSRVANTCNHQTVLDLRCAILVYCKPCDRANGSRYKKE